MAPDPRITWLGDVHPAEWIAPLLHEFCSDTGSVIPEGFEAYCRIFHPIRSSPSGAASKSWTAVAQENGRVVHPEMQIHMISRPAGSAAPEYDLNDFLNELDWGSLPLPERADLVDLLRGETRTPELCWFCIWDGFGAFDFAGESERVHLPNRDYVLYSGPIELAMAPLETGPPDVAADQLDEPWDTQSPNLWWPEDRAWFVATEIDYAWTYVGGTSRLINSILGSDELEALRARLTDQPFLDADTVNAALDAL